MLGVLCIIRCPVQLIRKVFSRLHLLRRRRRRHTFTSLWGAYLRFASLWHANSLGDSCVFGVHLSNVCWICSSFKVCWIFVKRAYLRVCWRSTIDLCLMNLPKRSSFEIELKVYTLSKILLWIKPSYFSLENAWYSWCMHQTGLFRSRGTQRGYNSKPLNIALLNVF